jgi:hypothetical protein
MYKEKMKSNKLGGAEATVQGLGLHEVMSQTYPYIFQESCHTPAFENGPQSSNNPTLASKWKLEQ